jgi:nickel/cobalt exporter
MTPFADLVAQGTAAAWLFVPTAVALGALHGLEPGHSKTMMAAFIVAVRGTVAQAVMLGLAATVSHTAIVWAIALGGMYLWRDLAPETFEPWLQFVSGLLIVAMALWMLARLRAASRPRDHDHDHSHACGHDHAHDIRTRFPAGKATTGQIVAFGLTGGLIPCPAAITVLLLCLQLDETVLGAALVASFSVGLALTLVAVGASAAWGVAHATRRSGWFADLAGRAPYVSGMLLVAVGIYVAIHGWLGIGA